MKKFVVLLVQFVCFTVHSQTISNDHEKWGLLFPSGKTALPAEYDRIKQTSRASYQDLFICVKDEKFGLYNFTDSTFTGCIYDSIYVDREMGVFILNNKKTGFVGYDAGTGKYQIVSPAYDAVYLIKDAIYGYDISGELRKSTRGVTVRIDSLWGAVNYSDGSPLLDIKYPFPLEKSPDGPFFRCVDRAHEKQTLIDPETHAEFHTAFLANITFLPQWNILYAVDDFGKVISEVKAWRYDTGTEIFTYTTTADRIWLHVYTVDILCIQESFINDDSHEPKDEDTYTFWNVTNSAKLLSCTAGVRDVVYVQQEAQKLEVWFYPNGNSARRNLVGEIYK